MNDDINSSLSKSWQSLKGVFSKLYKDFPNFVFIILFLAFIIFVSIGISGFFCSVYSINIFEYYLYFYLY